MLDTSAFVRSVVRAVPDVRPHLNGKALCFVWHIDPAYKTQEYYEATIEHLIEQVYNGNMGGEFIDIMYSLISGQLNDAYVQAWEDDNNPLPLPDYLDEAYKEAVVAQQDFVPQLYRDVVDARVDKTGAPTYRAALWANNWQSQYNNAVMLINGHTGGKLVWREGGTLDKCDQCVGLDGIVAYASEWQQLGVQPQNPPNPMISCGGWKCDCRLEPTDQRRSPNAFGAITSIIGASTSTAVAEPPITPTQLVQEALPVLTVGMGAALALAGYVIAHSRAQRDEKITAEAFREGILDRAEVTQAEALAMVAKLRKKLKPGRLQVAQ